MHPGHPADLAVVHRGSTGYDGQFSYRLALDPFTRVADAHGITLDNPPYRQQRIGLPLAAWTLSRTGLPVSWSLLAVNAAALLAAAWAGALLARRLGRHAWYGALVALSPGLVVAVTRDLTEPLATAFLLLGLAAWTAPRRGRAATVAAVAAFTAAVLTRETTLAVPAGLGLYETCAALRAPARRRALARAASLLVPLGAYLAWQHHLGTVWGELPLHATDGDVGLPVVHTLATLLRGTGGWTDWTAKDALLAHAWLAERLLLAALFGYLAVRLPRTAADASIRTGWAVAALLALTTTWGRDVAFLRAANEAIVLGVVLLLGLRTRGATLALAGVAAVSAYVAVGYGALL